MLDFDFEQLDKVDPPLDKSLEGDNAEALLARLQNRVVDLVERYEWDSRCNREGIDVASWQGNINTIAYNSFWGLDVRAQSTGDYIVCLAKLCIKPGETVEVCPLTQHTRSMHGPLDPHVPLGGCSFIGKNSIRTQFLEHAHFPLGYACFYRQTTEGCNIRPVIKGNELFWIATEQILFGEELKAELRWQDSIQVQASAQVRAQLPRPRQKITAKEKWLTLGSVRHGLSTIHGFGVFSTQACEAGDVLEICPVVYLTEQEHTMMRDYSMVSTGQSSVLALGLGACYNHHDTPQVAWFYDANLEAVVYVATRSITSGEELFISYGELYFSSRGKQPIQELES